MSQTSANITPPAAPEQPRISPLVYLKEAIVGLEAEYGDAKPYNHGALQALTEMLFDVYGFYINTETFEFEWESQDVVRLPLVYLKEAIVQLEADGGDAEPFYAGSLQVLTQMMSDIYGLYIDPKTSKFEKESQAGELPACWTKKKQMKYKKGIARLALASALV